jgi:hypothetical protein
MKPARLAQLSRSIISALAFVCSATLTLAQLPANSSIALAPGTTPGTLVVARDGVGGVQAYRQLPLGIPGRGRSPVIMQAATPLLFHSKVGITFTGKFLEQADSPAGPWTKIMGASSPWTIPVEQTRKFFRAQLY